MSDNVETPKRPLLKLKRSKKPAEIKVKQEPVVKTKPKSKLAVKSEVEESPKPVVKTEVKSKSPVTKKKAKTEAKPEPVKQEQPKKKKKNRKTAKWNPPNPPGRFVWPRLSHDDQKKALVFGKECFDKVQKEWPSLFDLDNPIPLKIGIAHDLNAEDKAPKHIVSNALWYFCRTPQYRSVMLVGATRFDMEGKPDGEVSEKHGIKFIPKKD